MGVPTTTAGGAHLRGAGRRHGDGFPCPPPRSGTMEPPSAPNPSGERGAAPSTARHGNSELPFKLVILKIIWLINFSCLVLNPLHCNLAMYGWFGTICHG